MAGQVLDLEYVLVAYSAVSVRKNQQGKTALSQGGAPNPAAAEALLDLRQFLPEMPDELSRGRLVFSEEFTEGRLLSRTSRLRGRVPDLRDECSRAAGVAVLPALINEDQGANSHRETSRRGKIPIPGVKVRERKYNKESDISRIGENSL